MRNLKFIWKAVIHLADSKIERSDWETGQLLKLLLGQALMVLKQALKA